MAPRTVFANLQDGLQMMSLFDQSLSDEGSLGITPCSATGTNVIVLTPLSTAFPPSPSYSNARQYSFVAAHTSTGAVTGQIVGLTTVPIYKSDGVTQLNNGDIVAGTFYVVAVNPAGNGLILVSNTISGTGTVTSVASSNSTLTISPTTGAVLASVGIVPNANLANMAADTLKGNNTGSGAAPVDLTVAQVLLLLGVRTGTWTPAIAAGTTGDLSVSYSSQNGQWLRIASFTYASCDIVTSAFTHTTASGQASVSGLPFNANDDFVGPLDFQGLNKSGGYTNTIAVTAGSSKSVFFELGGQGLNIGSLQITDMPSAGAVVLRFSIWYQTNDA